MSYRRNQKPGQTFASHETVNHPTNEYARGDVHTNTVEGFFSILKRGIDGIYHHIEKPYVGQYLGEFDFRYNTRDGSDGERLMLRQSSARRTG